MKTVIHVDILFKSEKSLNKIKTCSKTSIIEVGTSCQLLFVNWIFYYLKPTCTFRLILITKIWIGIIYSIYIYILVLYSRIKQSLGISFNNYCRPNGPKKVAERLPANSVREQSLGMQPFDRPRKMGRSRRAVVGLTV